MTDALPPDAVAYKRTRTFDQHTLPDALRADHRTKPGVWGLLEVLEGTCELVFADRTATCTPDRPGVIPPAEPHHVEVTAPVRLRVVFHRQEVP